MRLAVRPYGVLGSFKTRSGAVNKVMPVPAPGLPFIDPAGLHHIQQHGPQGAGGASGQIYQFLGIQHDTQFPAAVRAAIQAPCQAKLQYYGQKACLHVVGPDFNGRNCSRDQAVHELTAAYSAVLRQFGYARLGGLRLLPVRQTAATFLVLAQHALVTVALTPASFALSGGSVCVYVSATREI